MNVAYTEDKVYKDVGDTPQLFIDDDVVAVVKNITRRQHTPVKHAANPLIQRDKPWEVTPYFRTSTFNVKHDTGANLFRCWYEDFYEYFDVGIPSKQRLFYAQSEDGLNWEKPILGKHVLDGHDTNAIFVPEDIMVDNPSILLDPSESDPNRRFKMSHLHHDHRDRSGAPGGLDMQFSADGIDWVPHPDNPIIPSWQGDVGILTYDEIDEKYVLWGRMGGAAGGSAHPDMDTWFSPVWPARPVGIWGTRRRVYRTESVDLIHWADAELVWDPKEDWNLDDGLYGFVPWRAGEMHLGLLNVLHAVDNTMDMYLFHSRDGKDWKRFVDHQPFVPRGGEGSYDEFGIETPVQPFVVGDEIRFYYGGMKVHHDWWILSEDLRPGRARSTRLGVGQARPPSVSGDLEAGRLRLPGRHRAGRVGRDQTDALTRQASVHQRTVRCGRLHPGRDHGPLEQRLAGVRQRPMRTFHRRQRPPSRQMVR